MTESFPNSGRQLELDAAKALAIALMILGHSFEIVNPQITESSDALGRLYANGVVAFNNLFSASAFMFCLGVGLVYSRRQDAGDRLRRGVSLLAVGYGLNVVLGLVPWAIYGIFGTAAPNPQTTLSAFLCVDILQFAGLAFLLLGLAKYFRIPDEIFIAGAVGFLAVGTALTDRFGTGNPWLDNTIGLIFWTNPYSCFPLSLWLPYIVLGAIFGNLLIRTTDKSKFYRRVAGVGLTGLAFYGIYAAIQGRLEPFIFDYNEFFKQNPASVAITTCALALWFPLTYVWCRRLNPNGFASATIRRWSKNITFIFCAQWALIVVFCRGTKEIYPAFGSTRWYYLAAIGVAIVVLSDAIAAGIVRLNKKKNLAR